MELIFLGTASCNPTPSRGVSCLGVRYRDSGDVWLFDCGEGSQTQLMKSPLKAARVTKIFITHLHGDHLFGLPGFLCTLSQQKREEVEKGSARTPLELFGPRGLRNYLATNLAISGSALMFPYVVHEILDDCKERFESFDRGEEGFPSGDVTREIDPLLKCVQPVLGLEIPLLPNEERGRIFSFSTDTSVLLTPGSKFPRVTASPLRHRIFSLGFVVQEAEQPGRLDTNLLKARGLNPGPIYGLLKSGETVACPDGSLITPAEALGPRRKGTKLVVLGDTSDNRLLAPFACDADVVVHEATLENALQDQAVDHGHSTPAMAAKFALDVRTKFLILTHFSQRYRPLENDVDGQDKDVSESETVERLLLDARQCVDEKLLKIELAEDFKTFTIPRKL